MWCGLGSRAGAGRWSGRRVTEWRGCGHVPTSNRWGWYSARRGADRDRAAPQERSASLGSRAAECVSVRCWSCDKQPGATPITACEVHRPISRVTRRSADRTSAGVPVRSRTWVDRSACALHAVVRCRGGAAEAPVRWSHRSAAARSLSIRARTKCATQRPTSQFRRRRESVAPCSPASRPCASLRP